MACARPVTPPDEADRLREAAGAIDWAQAAGLAHHHGVDVLMVRRLRELGIALPPTTRRFLLRAERDTTINAEIQAAETRRLVELLDERGVTALPLKGPTLAVAAYGDVTARRSGDLDLLVRAEDVLATEDALLHGGYHYEEGPCSEPRRRWSLRIDGQLPPMARDDRVVRLELHRSVHQPIHRMAMDEDGMRRRARPRDLGAAGSVRSMGPEDMILVVCTHAGRNAWERFEWAACLARLCAGPEVDWTLVEDLTRRARVRRLVALAMGYALEIDPGLPDPVRRLSTEPGAARLAARMAPLSRPWTPGEADPEGPEGLNPWLVRWWFARRERPLDRLSVIPWMLSPKSDDIDGMRVPRRLEFLIWPRRWLRVLRLAAGKVLP